MQVRSKLKTYKAAFLSGKAFKRMEKGNFRGAAIVLMEICREVPDEENIEYLYYSLGRCHYRLGQPHSSMYWLSKSIELYKKGLASETSQRYRRCYRDAVELFCKILRIVGDVDRADTIIYKLDFGS
jgi:tetratricopeptide (TPR) repeat protein